MIADTTWLSDFQRERESGGARGPASAKGSQRRRRRAILFALKARHTPAQSILAQ